MVTICHQLRLATPGEHDVTNHRSNGASLASVCRSFKEVCYTVMYGENHFIFDLAMRGVQPQISGHHLPAQGALESWFKIFDGKPTGLWPLTPNSSLHLKEVTILAELVPKDGNKKRQALKERFVEVLSMFTKAEHSLKKLTVHVEKTTDCEHGHKRLGWNVCGEDDFVSRVNRPRLLNADCQPTSNFLDFIKEIVSVEDIALSANPGPKILEEFIHPQPPRRRKRRRVA